MSDARRALDYAEGTLGVHKVYDEAVKLGKELDDELMRLDKAQDDLRNLQTALVDQEMNLLSDQRGKHPDMSATAMDQRMKMVKHKDPECQRIRGQIHLVESDLSGTKIEIEIIKTRIRIATARMEELGGYFQYLAAVKKSQKSTTTESDPQA